MVILKWMDAIFLKKIVTNHSSLASHGLQQYRCQVDIAKMKARSPPRNSRDDRH